MRTKWSHAVGWLLGAGAACSIALACGQADHFDASPSISGGSGGGSLDAGPLQDTSPPTEIDGSPDGPVTEPPEAGFDQYSEGSRFQAVPVTYLVHAAPGLFDFRVCIKSGGNFVNDLPFPSDPDHFLPASNYPGVPRGGVVQVDDSLLGSEEQVTLYLVRADSEIVQKMQPALDPKQGCETLIDEGTFVPLTLERSALFDHRVRAIVIDKNVSGEAKVVGFSPEIDMEPTTTRVYTAHSSPFLEALQTQGHTFDLTYGDFEDSTSQVVIASDLVFDRPPTAPQDFTPPSSLESYSKFGFIITQTHNSAPLFELRASLADVQRITSPYETPQDFYTQSNGLLLLALGDVDSSVPPWLLGPGSWNPDYNGGGLHLLALRFTFQLLDP